MICSEIGSEGRNFQFAHHPLIRFDYPPIRSAGSSGSADWTDAGSSNAFRFQCALYAKDTASSTCSIGTNQALKRFEATLPPPLYWCNRFQPVRHRTAAATGSPRWLAQWLRYLKKPAPSGCTGAGECTTAVIAADDPPVGHGDASGKMMTRIEAPG